MNKPLNIGIIGGGMTGLTLAYCLSKKGHKVAVFEKSPELGGLLKTVEIYGSRLERYYHHTLASDKDIMELMEELGMSKDMEWLGGNNAVFYHNKIYPFSTPSDFMRFPGLGFLSKLRLGLGTLFLQRYRGGGKLKNQRTSGWIKKYMGEEVWRIIWQPLFQSKFGEYHEDIAMSWFWARVYFRSPAKFGGREIFGYPKNSYQKLINKLKDEIIKNKGEIFLNKPVDKIIPEERQGISLLAGQTTYNFDSVLATVAPKVLSHLLADDLRDFKEQLSKLVYTGNITAIFVLKEKLTDYYLTNILDKDIPFTAIIEHTNLVSPSRYNNRRIVYLVHYTPPGSDYFTADNENLSDKYLSFLERINPKIRSIVENVIISKEPYAQPIVTKDSADKAPKFQTPIKGLYQLSMAQIFPEDKGLSPTVREAKKLVRLLVD